MKSFILVGTPNSGATTYFNNIAHFKSNIPIRNSTLDRFSCYSLGDVVYDDNVHLIHYPFNDVNDVNDQNFINVCNNSNGMIILFDITDEKSYEIAKDYRDKISKIFAKPILLCGNKVDLLNEENKLLISSNNELTISVVNKQNLLEPVKVLVDKTTNKEKYVIYISQENTNWFRLNIVEECNYTKNDNNIMLKITDNNSSICKLNNIFKMIFKHNYSDEYYFETDSESISELANILFKYL